ncbi:MAG: CapA family protein [Acidimicrobiia bacterium]
MTLLFAGDVMMGRGVAPMVAEDPEGLFAGISVVVSRADVALANLESPLTSSPLVGRPPFDLRADPESAALLSDAGFDVLSLANNHVWDSGEAGVSDSIASLTEAGMVPLGVGLSNPPYAPALIDVKGIRVALLAFDATGTSSTRSAPGIARWGPEARSAIADTALTSDVVVVGLHGVAAYVDSDPVLERASREAVAMGADVVWAHGAHVELPTRVIHGSVAATGLGNLLFDQTYPGTQQGELLEVMLDEEGVTAWRTGTADHSSGRVVFSGWDEPWRDAVLFEGEWWNLARTVQVDEGETLVLETFPYGDVTSAGIGDVDRDGIDEIVVSFRRPFRETPLNRADPTRWQDQLGRSAHLGVFAADDLSEQWVAGTLRRPVNSLAVCDGGLAVAYDTLNDDTVVAVGGWEWSGFGFYGDSDLTGRGTLGCVDVDRDGTVEPAITEREFRH